MNASRETNSANSRMVQPRCRSFATCHRSISCFTTRRNHTEPCIFGVSSLHHPCSHRYRRLDTSDSITSSLRITGYHLATDALVVVAVFTRCATRQARCRMHVHDCLRRRTGDECRSRDMVCIRVPRDLLHRSDARNIMSREPETQSPNFYVRCQRSIWERLF